MLSGDIEERICNTITDIQEVDDSGWTGYRVLTAKQVVLLQIDTCQTCCEYFGARTEPEDPKEFVGAVVTDVRWGAEKKGIDDEYSGEASVEIQTSEGLLRLVVFNEHNGYYPHEIEASWLGYRDKQEL